MIKQTETWRVILACASSLVNALLTAASSCHTDARTGWSPTAHVHSWSYPHFNA